MNNIVPSKGVKQFSNNKLKNLLKLKKESFYCRGQGGPMGGPERTEVVDWGEKRRRKTENSLSKIGRGMKSISRYKESRSKQPVLDVNRVDRLNLLFNRFDLGPHQPDFHSNLCHCLPSNTTTSVSRLLPHRSSTTTPTKYLLCSLAPMPIRPSIYVDRMGPVAPLPLLHPLLLNISTDQVRKNQGRPRWWKLQDQEALAPEISRSTQTSCVGWSITSSAWIRITAEGKKRLDELNSRAGSVLAYTQDTLEVMSEKRRMAKFGVILDNTSPCVTWADHLATGHFIHAVRRNSPTDPFPCRSQTL